MIKTIWKFKLEFADQVSIMMPKGAEILSVRLQGSCPCIFAVVDPDAMKEERRFIFIKPYQIFNSDASKLIGMFWKNGELFHLFERVEK